MNLAESFYKLTEKVGNYNLDVSKDKYKFVIKLSFDYKGKKLKVLTEITNIAIFNFERTLEHAFKLIEEQDATDNK